MITVEIVIFYIFSENNKVAVSILHSIIVGG